MISSIDEWSTIQSLSDSVPPQPKHRACIEVENNLGNQWPFLSLVNCYWAWSKTNLLGKPVDVSLNQLN